MTTKCNLCKEREPLFKVRDTATNKELLICEFCEQPTHELIEPLDKETKKPTEELGRLHKIKKTRKEANCRVCNKVIKEGSECYNQAVKIKPFPMQTKVCEKCGKYLIKLGYEVAEKKKK